MTSPLIGITTSRSDRHEDYSTFSIAEAYVRAIERSGACPFVIPLGISNETLKSTLVRLDGILFSGGGDVHPESYGSEMHPLVNRVDPDRDRVELEAVHQVVKQGLPFLGICRGIQVINVAFGGSLYEDLLDQKPGAIAHDLSPKFPRHHIAHTAQVMHGSKLSDITKQTELNVNSMHHQGIKDLGAGLQAVAIAPDGLIEAIEIPGFKFGMAVQWHPECLPDSPEMIKLFQAFTNSARR